MKILKSLALATTIAISACIPQSKITFQERVKYFSRPEITATQYSIEDPANRLKKEILALEGIQGDSLDALLDKYDEERIIAKVESNQYATVISLEFSSEEKTHSIRFYDDGNDGGFDSLRERPKHTYQIAKKLLETNHEE